MRHPAVIELQHTKESRDLPLDELDLVLEWDAKAWSPAIALWSEQMTRRGLRGAQGLEIGARHGGVSYYFAKYHGASLCCTDLGPPSARAVALFESNGLAGQVTFREVDGTQIPFADGTFDFVVFKSVLGAVGSRDNLSRQALAVAEMQRVLRPGGLLFFAENARASWLHRFTRRVFVRWGTRWRYVDRDEMENFLENFSEVEIRTTGFLTAFTRSGWAKAVASGLDSWCQVLPARWHYVMFGYAVK